jgi:DNA-binding NarL/FixJ family response regulator
LIAASSARREQLAGIAAMASAVKLTVSSSISLERIVMNGADIVLADIDTPAFAAAVIRLAEDRPEGIGMVVLVDNPTPRWARNAISAGVNAILSRDVTRDELHLALQAAEANLVLLHPSAALGIFPSDFRRSRNMDEPIDQLTEREREVLRLISDGLGNREIAQKLKISGHTAKFHVSSILSKLGAASRAEAVSDGIRRGLIVI